MTSDDTPMAGPLVTPMGDTVDPADLESVFEGYRMLIEHTVETLCVYQDEHLVYVNPAGVRLLNAASATDLLERPITDFLMGESIAPLRRRMMSVRDTGVVSPRTPMTLLRVDGTTIDVEAIAVVTTWLGRPARLAMLHDTSGQRAAEDMARAAEHRFTAVVSSLAEGVVIANARGMVEFVNPAAIHILGTPGDRSLPVDGVEFDERYPIYDEFGVPIPLGRRPIDLTLRSGVRRHDVVGYDHGVTGRRVWVATTCSPLHPDSAESAVMMSFTDITEQRAHSERLVHQATHDSLTELPNRGQTLSMVERRLAGPARSPVAVLFVDIDNLKAINDSLGHIVGDRALRAAAQRIRDVLPAEDFFGRFGGDEFVAVRSGEIDDVGALGRGLHAALDDPMDIGGHRLTLSASIGVVVCPPTDSRSAAAVLSDADLAMYVAKSLGGNQTHLFDDSLRDLTDIPTRPPDR